MTVDDLKALYEKLGGEWQEVNIFGIRDEDNQAQDLFNDIIGVCFGNVIKQYQGTTDPGSWWTINPVEYQGVKGAAHLCEGFHKNIWQVGTHAIGTPFAHEALKQIGGVVRFWRDKDKNYKRDLNDPEQFGFIGINLHRAGLDDPSKIGKYSAGCQVIRHHEQFLEMMKIVKSSANYIKNGEKAKFSYMLFNKKEI